MCELGNLVSSKREARSALVEEASGCFIRAAASLAAGVAKNCSHVEGRCISILRSVLKWAAFNEDLRMEFLLI
jgi:hypothetical protein